MAKPPFTGRVGEIRPSQLMFSYGVGASVDLPHLTVLVRGLDAWPIAHMDGGQIAEERLRLAVRRALEAPIERLLMPPPADDGPFQAGNPADRIGVPVAAFPRWLRCPQCDYLGKIAGGLFEIRVNPFRPDRTHYVHINCSRGFKKAPTALPARFLLACENGHLDDFPWMDYVHNGAPCPKGNPSLRLSERGTAGDAASIYLSCEACKAQINMSHAFTADFGKLHRCRGRHPHLGNVFEPCEAETKTIILGASNSWFPISLSAFSLPEAADALGQMIDEKWAVLSAITEKSGVAMFRAIGQLKDFADFDDAAIWDAIEAKRNGTGEENETSLDLKTPEWEAFSRPDLALENADFKLREVKAPELYQELFERVVLVERLREVHALLGFTRIDSPSDWGEVTEIPDERFVKLSRNPENATWVPAVQVRGEGIFLQINEARLQAWAQSDKILPYDQVWQQANADWRKSRNLEVPEIVPQALHARYVLLHSLSHALMRQLCLECGYSSASIRERIYSQDPDENGEGAQAGILIYTAAPDSEGTLGGLVALGEPERLGHHLFAALEELRICASDPICSEHIPGKDQLELHGSACHACLFAPETSCEKGNKFLDRGVLIPTFDSTVPPFFPTQD